MNKEFSNNDSTPIFETAVKEQLRKVFADGLKQGTKAICGVVLEEIKLDKPAEEKIKTLKEFCEKSLGLSEVID